LNSAGGLSPAPPKSGLVSEGFCPYCETPLLDRALVRKIARGRSPCCGGVFKTVASERFGPGWSSVGGHNCEHVGEWLWDEALHRHRIEWRGGRNWQNR
jgi:hypothetical protein